MPWNRKDYPPDWEQIRERILIRAENKCEVCGVENYTIKENGTKVVLTIMHLNHDQENWEVKDEDLKAACQGCHLWHDRHHHAANRKYGRNHNGKHQLKLL